MNLCLVVLSIRDWVEAMGVGKGDNRLHSMRKENPGQKLKKHYYLFMMVEKASYQNEEMEEKGK